MRTVLTGWRSDRGETLIEFAFAVAMFLTIIFGTITFGLAVWRYNIVSDLAQEGARWASVRGSSTGAVQWATQADVQTFVRSRAVGLTVDVTTNVDPMPAPPQIVEVTVQTTYNPLTPLIPMGTLTLQSKAQMVMSR
jgi:Flp pilus assembly protein TadG